MKVFKKLLIPILLFSSIFRIAGCSKKKDKKKTDEIVTHEQAKGKIGKDGGKLSDKGNNVSLNIPKDALDKDTEITVKYVSIDEEINDAPTVNFLGAVEYGPSGTKFNKEVEARVKLTRVPTNSTISVYCYDEENDIWDYVTSATVSNGYATCKITHFSRYEYLDITPEMHDHYETLVRQAISEGKSDSWITQSYFDYLVDECHVFDFYPNFDGYYYRGSGLKIFGNYQIGNNKGDAEELSLVWGESNSIGNTYGKSTVSGSTTTNSEYKTATASSNVEGVSVTVVVEYKMITPQFSISASKTIMKKGETADVSLYCHYYDAANTIHQDFPLDGYYLSLTSSSSDFSVDRSSVTTNGNGMATFKVTCNKNNAKAVVKAIFDVQGDFGTHAEGMIHFSSEEGYQISGSVKVEYSFIFKNNPEVMAQGTVLSDTNGSFKFTLTYDAEGIFTVDEDNNINGTLEYKNIDYSLSNSKASISSMDSDGYVGTVDTKFLVADDKYDFEIPKATLIGKAVDGNFNITCDTECSLLILMGSFMFDLTVDGKKTDDEFPNAAYYSICCPAALLDGFTAETEDLEYNSQDIDGTLKFSMIEAGMEGLIIISSETKTTTETFKITK
ncbi:MAG: hypothetical protein J6Y28_00460 [Acholeplasmatales bacterium]|nr:hypothetical protein [Acholeplasmatales bacterium]